MNRNAPARRSTTTKPPAIMRPETPPSSSLADTTAVAMISSSTYPKAESPASATTTIRASSWFFAPDGAVTVSRMNRVFSESNETSESSSTPTQLFGMSLTDREIMVWAFPRFWRDITYSTVPLGETVCLRPSESMDTFTS